MPTPGFPTGTLDEDGFPLWITGLTRAAIGPTDSGAVLLGGQIGVWTFIYDDLGLTAFGEDRERPPKFVPPAKMLSAGGREAATSSWTVNADTSLASLSAKLS